MSIIGSGWMLALRNNDSSDEVVAELDQESR